MNDYPISNTQYPKGKTHERLTSYHCFNPVVCLALYAAIGLDLVNWVQHESVGDTVAGRRTGQYEGGNLLGNQKLSPRTTG